MSVCGHIGLSFKLSDINRMKNGLIACEDMGWVQDEFSFDVDGSDYLTIEMILINLSEFSEILNPLAGIINGIHPVADGPRGPWYAYYKDDVASIKCAFDNVDDNMIGASILQVCKNVDIYNSIYQKLCIEKIIFIKKK